MKKEKISDAVIRRLPRYYRYLDELHAKGIVRISSGSLGKRMGVTASQIRQDLSCFGEFGQQGYGYNIMELRAASSSSARATSVTRCCRTLTSTRAASSSTPPSTSPPPSSAPR